MVDCEVTLWTTCEAVVEEKWTLRVSHEVICALESGTRTPDDLLDDDDIEVVAVENVNVHSERTRSVRRVETAVSKVADSVPTASPPRWTRAVNERS